MPTSFRRSCAASPVSALCTPLWWPPFLSDLMTQARSHNRGVLSVAGSHVMAAGSHAMAASAAALILLTLPQLSPGRKCLLNAADE